MQLSETILTFGKDEDQIIVLITHLTASSLMYLLTGSGGSHLTLFFWSEKNSVRGKTVIEEKFLSTYY